jgi:hypothetical protein
MMFCDECVITSDTVVSEEWGTQMSDTKFVRCEVMSSPVQTTWHIIEGHDTQWIECNTRCLYKDKFRIIIIIYVCFYVVYN